MFVSNVYNNRNNSNCYIFNYLIIIGGIYENAILAADDLGIEAEVIKVDGFLKISKFNVMQIQALVINGKVVANKKAF